MAPLQTLLCGLASLAASSTAFTTTPPMPMTHHRTPIQQHQRTTRLSPLCSDKGGGSAIAAPKTKTVTTTVTKQEQKQKQKKKFKANDPDLVQDFEDAPMFRLYLIGDEGDDQEHVVNRVYEVVEDCSEDDAATLFKSAYQTGEAFMGKYPREIAEMYAEQLTRSDPIIYADVRDDKE